MANFYRISAVFVRDCCQTTGPDKFHFDTLISVPRRILIRCALMSPWNLFSNPNDTSPIKFDVPRQGEGRGGVSIFRRGFSHLLTLERRLFLLCKYVVDELKGGMLTVLLTCANPLARASYLYSEGEASPFAPLRPIPPRRVPPLLEMMGNLRRR